MTAFGAAWAMVVPGLLSAQSNNPPAPASVALSPPIVVTGHALSTKQAVRQLTRAISVPAADQLARFGDAACPSTAGLPPDYGQIVSERIRADALAAGVTVGKPGCRPNIIVMFVDSGRDTVRQIRESNARAFDFLTTSEVGRLEKDNGPIHSWMATELRNEAGDDVTRFGGQRRTASLDIHTGSIFNPSTQQAIVSAVVLFDNAAAIGKTLDQLADYAAMRTLAQISTKRMPEGDDTILTLFSPDAGASRPPSLTSFDKTYLKSLYTGPATVTYFQKTGSISSAINRAGAAYASSPPVKPPADH